MTFNVIWQRIDLNKGMGYNSSSGGSLFEVTTRFHLELGTVPNLKTFLTWRTTMGKLSDILKRKAVPEVVSNTESTNAWPDIVERTIANDESEVFDVPVNTEGPIAWPEAGAEAARVEPELVEISLGTHAKLSHLNVTLWDGKKTDRDASADVAIGFRGDPQKFKLIKSLLDDNPHLQKLKKIERAARKVHSQYTQPWLDRGPRLIPAISIMDIRPEMDRFYQDFYEELDLLCDTFEDSVEREAEQSRNSGSSLGDNFKRSDYPSKHAIRAKFSFTYVLIPLAEADNGDNFIGSILDESREYLESSYKKFYGKQNAAMMSGIYRDSIDELTDIRTKLDYKFGDKATGFHSTLPDRARDKMYTLRNFNFNKEPSIELSVHKLEAALYNVDAESLRDSEALRIEVVDAITSVLNVLKPLSTGEV